MENDGKSLLKFRLIVHHADSQFLRHEYLTNSGSSVLHFSFFKALQMQRQQEVRGPGLSARHQRGSEVTAVHADWSVVCLTGRWPWQDKSFSLPCGKKQWKRRVPPSANITWLRPNRKLSLKNTPQLQGLLLGTRAKVTSPRMSNHCQRGVDYTGNGIIDYFISFPQMLERQIQEYWPVCLYQFCGMRTIHSICLILMDATM